MKQADFMGSFAEVLIKNQAKNINKTSDEIGKKLETFNDSLTAHNKPKSSTGQLQLALTQTNKSYRAATISVNPKSTSRTNTNVEDDGSSSSSLDSQEEATDTRKGKTKRVTNFNVNKKVVRGTGDRHPLAEDELSLYGGSDLDEQTDRLVDTTVEDDLIKDITNDFNAVKKTGPRIGKKLASITNNV